MRYILPLSLLTLACASMKVPTYKSVNHIVAHRGAFKKNGFPENSIASLQEAIRLGCAGSEFDVRMSADDSLVINHDAHHNKLEIEKTRYAELIQYPLSNDEKLPTLREYLLAGEKGNKHTDLVLEIKPSGLGPDRARAIVDNVLDLVKEIKPSYRIVYISFDYNMCTRILEKLPKAHVQYLNGDKTPDQLKEAGIKGMDYNYSVYKKHPEWITRAKELGIVLNVWTVNELTQMDDFLKQGFDLITTNEPEEGLKRQ
ncbi:MAG: glycerophosphodiester phosphodiesterase [Bacteroidetes bacterium]|nr:glycerophosphodiester phosphodiesterase [Bacteroidota bacterium]